MGGKGAQENFFGWTIEQWAIVLAAYPAKSPEPKDILQSKKAWTLTRGYQPGSEQIVVDEWEVGPQPMDWQMAIRAFEIAYEKKCSSIGFVRGA